MTRRLLIVDDEPEILAEMAEYFEAKGYRVEQAADGLEALERIEAGAPDALITDLKMPRCDGFDLIKRLREANNHVPIVAVAGTFSHADLARAGALGAQVVMRKPIGLRELAEKLRALLEPAGT